MTDVRHGPAFIGAVRARPELAGVHVVVCADLDSPDDLRDALDTGADDVMRIPFEPQVLAVRVATGLRAARLRGNEAMLRSLVDSIPGAIYRCACDGNWTMEWLSDEIETISGYPASDFVGNAVRTFASIEHPEDHDYVASSVRESVASGRPFALEYRLVRRDGSVCWVLERGLAQESGDGRWWLDGAIFDITARRAAEQALREQEVTEAQLAEVRASRMRIIEAGDRARRDIERNLHDGAQQRLVSVALELSVWLAQHRDLPEDCRTPVVEALAELRGGLAELRDLARGLHPAVLSDHGLEHGAERRRGARDRGARGRVGAGGLEAEVLEATPGRPSVVVRARGTGGGRTLMLCVHSAPCSCASRSRSIATPRSSTPCARPRRRSSARRRRSPGAPYWADAAFIAAAGIPTVMFGASGEGAHAVEEWVSVEDSVTVTRVLVAAAQRLCG